MKVNKQLTLPNLIYFHAQQLCIIPHWPNYPYYAVFWTCSDDDDELPLLDRLADGKKDVDGQSNSDISPSLHMAKTLSIMVI